MARYFTVNDRYDYAGIHTVASDGAYTFAARVNYDSLSPASNGGVFSWFGSNSRQVGLFLKLTPDSGKMRLDRTNTVSGIGYLERSGFSGFTAGTWHSIIATYPSGSFTDATQWNIYVDGDTGSSDTTSDGVGTEEDYDWFLATGNHKSLTESLKGKMAEFAAWDRVLTASERAGLDAGLSPRAIVNGLVFYTPLLGQTNEPDYISGDAASVGGASIFDHPPVFYPDSMRPGLELGPAPTGAQQAYALSVIG